MILKKLLLLSSMLLSLGLWAQPTTPNKTDDAGKKQGEWSALHPNGNVRYKGSFKDDKPVGKFEYFDTYGNLIGEVTNAGDSADIVFYHLNKKVMAEGKYYQQMRAGKWKFYDADGDISAQKFYAENKENGPARIYYKDGQVSRDCNYRNGVLHGQLKDFFPEGKPKYEAMYVDGNPDGKVKHFHTNGSIRILGFYRFAVQEGTWTYFGPDGKVKRYEVYKNGFKKKSFTPEEAKAMREAKADSTKNDTTVKPEPKQ